MKKIDDWDQHPAASFTQPENPATPVPARPTDAKSRIDGAGFKRSSALARPKSSKGAPPGEVGGGSIGKDERFLALRPSRRRIRRRRKNWQRQVVVVLPSKEDGSAPRPPPHKPMRFGKSLGFEAPAEVLTQGEFLGQSRVLTQGQDLRQGGVLTRSEALIRGDVLAQNDALGQDRVLAQGQDPGQGDVFTQSEILEQGRVLTPREALTHGEVLDSGGVLDDGGVLAQGRCVQRRRRDDDASATPVLKDSESPPKSGSPENRADLRAESVLSEKYGSSKHGAKKYRGQVVPLPPDIPFADSQATTLFPPSSLASPAARGGSFPGPSLPRISEEELSPRRARAACLSAREPGSDEFAGPSKALNPDGILNANNAEFASKGSDSCVLGTNPKTRAFRGAPSRRISSVLNESALTLSTSPFQQERGVARGGAVSKDRQAIGNPADSEKQGELNNQGGWPAEFGRPQGEGQQRSAKSRKSRKRCAGQAAGEEKKCQYFRQNCVISEPVPIPLPAPGMRNPAEKSPEERWIAPWHEDGQGLYEILDPDQSDAQLLAHVIQPGSCPREAIILARELLDASAGLHGLANAPRFFLETLNFRRRPARAIAAAMHLASRVAMACPPHRPMSRDVLISMFRPHLGQLSFEEVHLVLLDRLMRFRGRRLLARGGASSCSLYVRDVLGPVLESRCSAFALVHNHPSGSPELSEADRIFTDRVDRASRVVSLKLVDHLIITPSSVLSGLVSPRWSLASRRKERV